METIKVNMTPCEDVKTIHASQNDNEGREWGFELHNNGEKIDSSSISDQMVFKAYEGGTEELLPSGLLNGSVDLGSLTWGMESSGRFYSSSISGMKNSDTWNATKIYSDLDYTVQGVQTWVTDDKIIGVYGITIYIRDSSYASADDLRNALQGVYLWYEKSESTPTTTPINADIKYPQELLTNQQFTYRESPTEEDGLANIVGIKGQTIKWNQLVSSASGWVSNNGTLSQSGNTYTYTVTALGDYDYQNRMQRAFPFVIPKGHKMFLSCEFYYPRNTPILIYMIRASAGGVNRSISGTAVANQWTTISGILYDTSTEFGYYQLALATIASNGYSVGDSVQVRNPMAIDLTMLFGEGNEPTTVEEFTSLFSLPYYAYNQGTLLSFMGNGIKTVGFNQWDGNSENGKWINDYSTGAVSTAGSSYNVTDFIHVFPNTTYYHTTTGSRRIMFYDGNKNPIPMTSWEYPDSAGTIVSPPNAHYIRFTITNDYLSNFCFNISDTSKNGTYEPYTESALSLPISTYFPNGMKSAGNVYDELTESKAITRVGAVDLGSLNWTYQSSSGNMYVDNVVSNRKNNLGFNAICSKYQQVNEDTISGVASLIQDKSFAFQYSFNGRIIVRDTSYTDATVFKQAMADQNVKLYYELATPTETSFTTASLVTENTEIPLSNEDGVLIGKCTEQLSSESGFFDAKIKLADEDGECYSNKIQLHVERSPQ